MPSTTDSAPSVDLTAKASVDRISAGFPATELIEKCLKFITANAATVHRDVHTIGQIMSRSKIAYEGILHNLRQIELVDSPLEATWQAVNASSFAIPRLESFILEFQQTYAKGSHRTHLPPDDSTANGIIYVNNWKYDREFFTKSLETSLKHSDFQGLSKETAAGLVARFDDERTKDDVNTLGKLSKFLQENTLTDKDLELSKKNLPNGFAGMKKDISNILQKLLRSSANELVRSIVIRTLMMFAIPCTLLTSENLEREWKLYLKQSSIWEAFQALISKVSAHLNEPTAPGVDFEKEFVLIEKLLLNLGDTEIDTTSELLDLFKLVPRIYRQYQGRSIALIKTLFFLDQHSRAPEQKEYASYRYELKQLMVECVGILDAFTKIKLDISSFDDGADDYVDKVQEIDALFEKAADLFEDLNVDDTLLDEQTATYNEAGSVDEAHLNEARDMLFST